MREHCLNALVAALFITLAVSYLRYFDVFVLNLELVQTYLPRLGGLGNPTVFKWHITHNFFMSFAVLFWGYRVVQYLSKRNIWFYAYVLLMTAALINVLHCFIVWDYLFFY